MTDEEWNKTQNWLKSGAKAAPPKPPAPLTKDDPPAPSGGVAADLLGSTSATISGIGKGLAQMGAPPGGISLREADPKGPVATWAKQEDEKYPVAEKAGRYAAEYAPLAMLPDVGAPAALGKMVPELPRLARIVGKGLEGTWKGGVGGATQGDPTTGAAVGGGSAAASAAFMAMPEWLKYMAGLAAIEGGREAMGRGAHLPWGSWHLAHPLAMMAAALLGKAPGVSGALGAKALGDDESQ